MVLQTAENINHLSDFAEIYIGKSGHFFFLMLCPFKHFIQAHGIVYRHETQDLF